VSRPDILYVVGARPNFVKVAPVIDALKLKGVRQELVHTGQHLDPEMSDVFLRELEMPQPDYRLGVGPGLISDQFAAVLTGVAAIIREQRPRAVVVAGDVTSTLAGALAAVQNGVPVVHIESGLRSFDNSMPEEHNRRLVDHLADLCLTHSESADANLLREGIDAEHIEHVGNTMIDTLLRHLPRARADEPERKHGLVHGQFVLVTLHRPKVVDDPDVLGHVLAALDELAARIPVVFPVHPRTRARAEVLGADPEHVLLLEPLPYIEFIGLEAAAQLVITDSGGVQEETTALGVPCVTFRENTERPITCSEGTNRLIGTDPEQLINVLDLPRRAGRVPELWDGAAGGRAANAVCALLERLAADAGQSASSISR
jgi:UDP-N-acetylglucosamine 2-epimerase (non-hydrolysing)